MRAQMHQLQARSHFLTNLLFYLLSLPLFYSRLNGMEYGCRIHGEMMLKTALLSQGCCSQNIKTAWKSNNRGKTWQPEDKGATTNYSHHHAQTVLATGWFPLLIL